MNILLHRHVGTSGVVMKTFFVCLHVDKQMRVAVLSNVCSDLVFVFFYGFCNVPLHVCDDTDRIYFRWSACVARVSCGQYDSNGLMSFWSHHMHFFLLFLVFGTQSSSPIQQRPRPTLEFIEAVFLARCVQEILLYTSHPWVKGWMFWEDVLIGKDVLIKSDSLLGKDGPFEKVNHLKTSGSLERRCIWTSRDIWTSGDIWKTNYSATIFENIGLFEKKGVVNKTEYVDEQRNISPPFVHRYEQYIFHRSRTSLYIFTQHARNFTSTLSWWKRNPA